MWPSLHVIDAVKACLACGVNVHHLVPVSESCCPLHMFARFLCLYYMNVQTSSHTMTTICRYAHKHSRRRARPKSCKPRLLTIFQAVYEISRKINGVLTETKGLGGSSWNFFFLFVSTLSSLADVTVKVDELLVVPRVCRQGVCWG